MTPTFMTKVAPKMKAATIKFLGEGQGFRLFSRFVGQNKVTHGAKNGGSFSETYQTFRYLGSILYLHTDTLTADHTVKPVLGGHSKKEDQLLLNAGREYCRML